MFSNRSKIQGSWLYLDRNSKPVVGGVYVLWYLVVVAVGGIGCIDPSHMVLP